MSEKSAIKRLKGHRVECTVTIDQKKVEEAGAKALQKLGSQIKISGFRPGKAPAAILRQKIKPDEMFEETVRMLLPETLKALIEEHNLKPILPPKIEAQSANPLTLLITFTEHPDVTVKGKFTVAKKPSAVTEKDVKKMVDYILERHQKTKEVDRAAASGDRITMDFFGKDANGKEIDGIRTTSHSVVLGSDQLIPGFEEQLKGLKKGAEKSFILTFPVPYHAKHLEGKPVTFSVTVKNVEEIEKPPLTDDFAREHLHAQSAAEFHTRIEESMHEQEERVERQRRENELFEMIRKATTVEIAPELIEEEEHDLLADFTERLKGGNLTLEEWLKKSGKKIEDLHKEVHADAEAKLTLRFGVQKLVADRAIEVSDAEISAAIAAYLQDLPEAERRQKEPTYQKGFQGWEQFTWKLKVEKLVEELLAKE
ncbi:MAG: trigger factor [Candidatus Peribacteraceae bacterium]|nr:trigger factor [Candidatus Peribacteraceae bacterium]